MLQQAKIQLLGNLEAAMIWNMALWLPPYWCAFPPADKIYELEGF